MGTIPTGKITSVYFETGNGHFIKIADRMDNQKLLKLCFRAQRQETIGTWSVFVKQHPNAMLLRSFETDFNSAVKLVAWIQNYDFQQPVKSQTITMKLVGSEDFGEVIKMYYSIISMRISQENRGQDLRNDILHYVNAAPLSSNEFIMLHECCHVDVGMLNRVIDKFLWARINGGKFAYQVDQAREIETYCKKAGIWEKMMARHENLLATRATAEADRPSTQRLAAMQDTAESKGEKEMWNSMAFSAADLAGVAPPFNPPRRAPGFRGRGTAGSGGGRNPDSTGA